MERHRRARLGYVRHVSICCCSSAIPSHSRIREEDERQVWNAFCQRRHTLAASCWRPSRQCVVAAPERGTGRHHSQTSGRISQDPDKYDVRDPRLPLGHPTAILTALPHRREPKILPLAISGPLKRRPVPPRQTRRWNELPAFADQRRVHLNLNRRFLDGRGLYRGRNPCTLPPSALGYHIWAEGIEGTDGSAMEE